MPSMFGIWMSAYFRSRMLMRAVPMPVETETASPSVSFRWRMALVIFSAKL